MNTGQVRASVMYDREWLHEFAMTVRALTLQVAVANSCIMSTRIGLGVLTHYGVQASARAVRAEAYNLEGYRLRADGVPIQRWPSTAWSVGIAGTGVSDPVTKSWDGHLVLVLRNPSRVRTLVDLSADQMDRPQRGIHIPGPVFMDLPAMWTPHDPSYSTLGSKPGDPDATILGYWPQVSAGRWQESPDWVRDHAEHVAAVVARLDEQYGTGV